MSYLLLPNLLFAQTRSKISVITVHIFSLNVPYQNLTNSCRGGYIFRFYNSHIIIAVINVPAMLR